MDPRTNAITPVFVLGAGHSGTTISYRMLALHPDIAWLSQFSQRGGRIPGRGRLPGHKQIDLVLRKMATHDWRKKHGRVRQKVVPTPKEAHQIWDHILPKDGSLPPDQSVERMRAILEEEHRFWKKDFLIAKRPRFYRDIPVLLQAYPHSKFILVVRDGRAVALAHRHKPRKLATGLSEQQVLLKATAAWTDVLERAQAEIPREQLFELRYEALCEDVHTQLKAMLDFIGLDAARFPFDRSPKTLHSANERRFREATEEEKSLLHDRLAGTLIQHGYRPDSWDAAH